RARLPHRDDAPAEPGLPARLPVSAGRAAASDDGGAARRRAERGAPGRGPARRARVRGLLHLQRSVQAIHGLADGPRRGIPRSPEAHAGQETVLRRQEAPGVVRGRRLSFDQAYFCTMAPRFGRAASMCLAAPLRTALYALMTAGRRERFRMSSVTESKASDTSSDRLAR